MKTIGLVLFIVFLGNLLWGNPQEEKSSLKFQDKRAENVERFLLEKGPPTQYNEPADLVDLIPIVRDIKALIPHRFFLAYHNFEVKGHTMVIHHRNLDRRTQLSPKRATIALEYTGDIGTSFGTEVEMDLFYTPALGLTNWSRYPLGNYRMTLDQTQIYRRDALYLKAQTKF